MKIAILSCFYPFRGGIAQFNANLLTELSKRHSVRAFNFSRQYPDFLFPGKTQTVTPEDEAQQIESTAVLDTANPFNWSSAAKAIRSWGPEILVLRFWMSYFAPSLGYVARHMGNNCKVIAILDNVIPHERHFFDSFLTKSFLRSTDGNITLCAEVANDLLALKPDAQYRVMHHPIYSHFGQRITRNEAERILGLSSESLGEGFATERIGAKVNGSREGLSAGIGVKNCGHLSTAEKNCVDLESENYANWAEKRKKNILFFGLIREYKGLDILIEAFDNLSEEYQLIIAGEPYGSFDSYGKLIEKNRNKERIFLYTQYIRDSEVTNYFSAADLVVLPYRTATQSGISAIACHFEVPMIVTDVGGLRETIAERGIGIVCSENSPARIAEEIENYFSDSNLRQNLKLNIVKAKEALSWDSFCKKFEDFAESLMR